jgi:hypothetical protein
MNNKRSDIQKLPVDVSTLIHKLDVATKDASVRLTFDEMQQIKNILIVMQNNTPRPAIFAQQLDLFAK